MLAWSTGETKSRCSHYTHSLLSSFLFSSFLPSTLLFSPTMGCSLKCFFMKENYIPFNLYSYLHRKQEDRRMSLGLRISGLLPTCPQQPKQGPKERGEGCGERVLESWGGGSISIHHLCGCWGDSLSICPCGGTSVVHPHSHLHHQAWSDP